MTSQTNQPGADAGDDAERDTEPAGVEIGLTEGEGTTFEPEEDPEAHGETSP